MKNHLFRFLMITAVLPCLLTVTNAQNSKAKSTAENSALLYRITGKGLTKPSYLFGTIHVICQSDMIPAEKLNGYFEQADRLVLEIDMDDPSEMETMQKAVLLPDGKTFTASLSAEQMSKVDEMLKSMLGASVEQVKSLRPMMLQVMAMSSPKVIGCNPPSSYEAAFIKAANDKKRPVEGLETVASQISALDSQPLEKQARQLYDMAVDPEKSVDDFRKLLTAYKTQNSEALYDLIDAQIPADDKAFQSRLVDGRNIAWIPKIEKMILEKPTFIAVGGGHLGGKNGVVKLLRAKGYQVQAIRL